MIITLRKYQQDAIEGLKETIEKLLRSSENETCIFQAPTGSGKTVMVSELLKKLIKNRQDDKKFSFVWISVRMLHEQSKEKLEKYYEDDRLIQCSYFDDLQDKKINENEILFINWHSINKKDINIFVRENEQDNNLNSIIANTKAEGREIILIIDESHHTASSEKSRELIDIIDPKITLEMSATPQLKENIGGLEKVNLSDVKNEEMIKSEISVNPDFLGVKVGLKSADELVIGQALKKRDELVALYKKFDATINPLVLIQLPDQNKSLINKKEDVLKILKDKFKITEENGKLAVWLSEEKTETLANIEKNDNEVEVLVFKQAPALGWDCPRASILVIFRETKSFEFTIQTIGRIMRMPELQYYSEPELNKGFVFTNLPDIQVTEDYAKDYVTIYEAKRDEKLYQNIALHSIFLRRQRERTRLSGEFIHIFSKVAKEVDLKDKVTSTPSKLVNPIIAEGRIVNVDKMGEIEHKGIIEVTVNPTELQQLFDSFISQNCSPYAPSDSSGRMKTALYKFLTKEFGLEDLDQQGQKIILGKENVQAFVDTINRAKDMYKQAVVKQLSEKRELQEIINWEIPASITYNSRYVQYNKIKSIMKPYYTKKSSEPERLFTELLERSDNVAWWFKNGESEIKYFSILYKDESGFERGFYVDFIVQFKDGTIGLFDTKGGMTAKDAKTRAEGLTEYIQKENKKGKKLIGGIVMYVNGSWRYNDNRVYSYNENNLEDWKFFTI
ncbi:MAG TPA: DEAD/DEAH box helicase family protein [Candidatus Saccharimonadales bacterium]|nr:DEAD/DEAH box helicase family protein [Candidatus Saccharimonadales bacterium]